MIHFPHVPDCLADTADGRQRVRQDTWRAMEWLCENGLCRAIGVSNYGVDELADLLSYARIRPHVNQCEFHPFYNLRSLRDYCHRENVRFTVSADTFVLLIATGLLSIG